MVYHVLSSLKSLLKFKGYTTDNNVFRLHYRATVIFLVTFSLLVTSSQFFGDPIDCMKDTQAVPNPLMDTFCWIHSTFTLPDALNKEVGVEVVHPGVEQYTEGEKRVYHKYYQWVCFVLFLQGIAFYLPRYLWKMWEGGRVRALMLNLDAPVITKEEREEKIVLLLEYFKTNLRHHNTYFGCFVFCEVLTFVNVIVQMYLIDIFLGGAFSTYGIDVLRHTTLDQANRIDPMVAVFPRMTKCTFYRFGSSGDVQKDDVLCLLPLNNVNEKIYIFLWFWFVFLTIITAISLVYRMLSIFSAPLRKIVLQSRARFCDRNQLNIVLSAGKIGDWFLFHLLAKNMDGVNFHEFIKHYSAFLLKKEQNMNTTETVPMIPIESGHVDSEKSSKGVAATAEDITPVTPSADAASSPMQSQV